MEIAGTGKRVRIYVGEHDRAEGRHEPLWETILDLLRDEGAAGATMVRGLAGFGAHGKLHTARLADLAPDLPVVVEWLDGPERVERLLPRVCDLVREGTVTVEDVEVVKYAHREPLPVPAVTVGEVMTRDVVAVHPDTPVGELVRLLLDRDFRSVPVVDDGNRLVGIVTNRDLIERGGLSARLELLGRLDQAALERALAGSGVRAKTTADVMTRDVISVRPEQSLRGAAHAMVERSTKRLPVVDADGKLVGMLSRIDVLRTMGEDYHAPGDARPAPAGAHTVGELMRRDAPAVQSDAAMGDVLDAVTSTRLNRAIVVDPDGVVLGVVGDADLLTQLDPGGEQGVLDRLMGRRGAAPRTNLRARDAMHQPAVTVGPDTPIPEAARRMLESRRKVLPVVDADGRLLGVVDRADLLAALGPTATADG